MTSLTTDTMQRRKFLLGGVLIATAILYLITSTTQSTSHYYYSIDEINARRTEAVGEKVRISGAVLGKSIVYNPETLELRFTIAHVPGNQDEVNAQGGLASVLQKAVSDPTASRLDVFHNGPLPDLLRNEAQAIMDGHLTEDGIFVADTLLLKCPTKYDDELPAQVSG